MVNKRGWLGMLVMVLVFGMTVVIVGCEDDEDGSGVIIVKNERDQSITARIFDSKWGYDYSITDIGKDVEIASGESKNFNVTWSSVTGNGTLFELTMYINDDGKVINVYHGSTIIVTAKANGTVSVQ
ncbi:MAG: hypothetical protein LBH20_04250 [Treponema sp.]|jgi:hypothetical protein|nr:hypothetical protein [Treponema sp.]